MSSVGPGIDLLSYVSFLTYQFGAGRLTINPLVHPGAQWKQVEAGLMDNASILLALVLALCCGVLIGALLARRPRKNVALAALAQALDDARSAAEGLTVPPPQHVSLPSRQKPHVQVSISPEEEHGKLKRIGSRLGRFWPGHQSHQTEATSVESLLQNVQSLQRIIEQAQIIRNNGTDPELQGDQTAAASRTVSKKKDRPQGLHRENEPDSGSHVNYNAGNYIKPVAQPLSTTTAKAHEPTIGRRKDRAPTTRLDSAAEALIRLYNNAVDDRGLRSDFRGRFQPLRIGTINAPERRRDPNLAAEIREASEGNFFAVKLEAQSEYLVIPGFDMAVKHTSFEAGAIGEIFDCPDYNPDLSYLFVKVRRPAVFKVIGQNWELQEKGELELGPGE